MTLSTSEKGIVRTELRFFCGYYLIESVVWFGMIGDRKKSMEAYGRGGCVTHLLT